MKITSSAGIANGIFFTILFIVSCGSEDPNCGSPADLPIDFSITLAQISRSENIALLESLVCSFLPTGEHGLSKESFPGDLRFPAYARLGELATTESLGAVHRIEEAAQRVELKPEQARLGPWPSPTGHWSDFEVELVAAVKPESGPAYGLIVSPHLGGLDIYLVSNNDPTGRSEWTRPRLVRNVHQWGVAEAKLVAIQPGHLDFSFINTTPEYSVSTWADLMGVPDEDRVSAAAASGPEVWEIDIDAVTKDSDDDGWTDREELRLGLDPNDPDSDSDGVRDGNDTTPDYSNPRQESLTEDQKIFQKAIFATFGLTGSRDLLIVEDVALRVPIWGYAGPVLYGIDIGEWWKLYGFRVPYVNWTMFSKSSTKAVVEIIDYEHLLASASRRVTLRRIGDEWYVVGRAGGIVS